MRFVTRTAEYCKSETELVVLNLLSGAVDVLNGDMVRSFCDARAGLEVSREVQTWLCQRGYVLPEGMQEEALLEALRLKFSTALVRKPRLYIAPSFKCVLRCTYCNQWDLDNPAVMDTGMVHAAFNLMDRVVRGSALAAPNEKPLVHLYGGEPLLPENKPVVQEILEESAKRGYRVSVITNGVFVSKFLPLLQRFRQAIGSFLISLDGPPEFHDARRPFANGKGTSSLVCRAISDLLAHGFRVTVQAVVDVRSVSLLAPLVSFARTQGWVNSRDCRFAAAKVMFPMHNPPPGYDVRNTDDVEFLSAYVRELKLHPEIKLFAPPLGELGIVTFLRLAFDRSVPPFPQLRGCDAANGLVWAFGPDGNIYPCVETFGYMRFSVGRYHPEYSENPDKRKAWIERKPESIPKCQSCKWLTACGGGCPLSAMVSGNDAVCPPNQALFETFVQHTVVVEAVT